ncbi:MAG: hypothetical protein JXL81_07830 [Deltaproteobacteria bacterium]|nr:hypothetical protein [Deltaproteobacteria bacterium]
MRFSAEMMGTGILILLTVAIYLIILFVFVNARHKYKGGIIGQVINLIITTIGFLLVADIALFLVPNYGFLTAYTINVIFKIIAMVSLAVGGLKLFSK